MKKLTIKEVKAKLLTIEDAADPFITHLQRDTRKGVQTALKQWHKKREAKEALEIQFNVMSRHEEDAKNEGYQYIAGLDEVGRGPLAGPVVAAAVILDDAQPIYGLNDSKKLSAARREELFLEIKDKALAVGVGVLPAKTIDQLNILRATKMAMIEAVQKLNVEPEFLLIDAETIDLSIAQKAIVKGDSNSNSIAAASIIAKVTRDQLMKNYDKEYPGYNFASNVGYGTQAHLEGLELYGVTPTHRKSFAPVSNYL